MCSRDGSTFKGFNKEGSNIKNEIQGFEYTRSGEAEVLANGLEMAGG